MVDNKIYKNLVFDGGGARGIAFIGCIKALEEQNMMQDIKKIIGTSVGAIIATAVAIGYTSEEMKDILMTKDFTDFQDNSRYLIINALQFIKNYGYYRGNNFLTWIELVIETKTKNKNITFKKIYEQYDKELIIVGTCVNRGQAVYFNHKNYPDMMVKDAIRISGSIPFYFDAIKFRDEIYIDGGISDSYPFGYFDNDLETLGFKLKFKLIDFKEDKSHSERIFWIKDYIINLTKTILTRLENIHVKDYYWKNTILIDALDVGITEFDISREKKQSLIDKGYETTLKFLDIKNKKKNI